LIKLHQDAQSNITIAAVRSKDSDQYGALKINEKNIVEGFYEKKECINEVYVNGGCYLMEASAVKRFPKKKPLSLEQDIFPSLAVKNGTMIAVKVSDPFIDIGTPKRISLAHHFIVSYKSAFSV